MSTENSPLRLRCSPVADAEFGPAIQCGQFDFTLLFEQSVFSIGFSSLFLLLLPFQLYRLRHTQQHVKASIIYKASLALALISVGIQLGPLILWVENPLTSTAIAAAAISTVSCLAWTVLVLLEYQRSLRTSSLTLLFILSACVGDSIQLHTLILRNYLPTLSKLIATSLSIKVTLLLLACWSKTPFFTGSDRTYGPEEVSHVLSRSVFWWLNALFWRGSRTTLSLKDLFPLDNALRSGLIYSRAEGLWVRVKNNSSRRYLWFTVDFLKRDCAKIILPRLAVTALRFAQAYFIESCLNFLEKDPSTRDQDYAYGLIGAAALIYSGIAIATAAYSHQTFRLVTKFRGATVSLLERKLLDKASGDDSAIATLSSTDIDQSVQGLLHTCDLGPRVIEVIIGVWLLWRQIGPAAIAPVLIVVLSFGLQSYLSKKLPARQGKWLMAVQGRIGFAVSLLRNIKSVRLAGLTPAMGNMLQEKRVRELDAANDFRWLNVWVNATSNAPNLFSALTVFAIYSIQASIAGSAPLSASKAFTSLALIALLTSPATALLQSLPALTSAAGCLRRIEAYLLAEDWSASRNNGNIPNGERSPSELSMSLPSGVSMIVVENVPLVSTAERPLRNSPWSFSVDRATVCLVTGPTASGKSTLLKAIIGDIVPETGHVSIADGSVAYCSQTPWIPNDSIRRAIVGPRAFDEPRYREILRICALDNDIDTMPLGDETPTGSKGSLLSGGQRQRLALARALYSHCSILILDDSLSGLDRKTMQHVGTEIFGPVGYARNRKITVVLATHDAQAAIWADQVVSLGVDGNLLYSGPTQNWPEFGIVAMKSSKNGVGPMDASPQVEVSSKRSPMALPSPKRQTSDLNSWLYYAQAVGWLPLVIFFALIVTAAFGANFQRLWIKLSTSDPDPSLAEFLGVYATVNFLTFCLMAGMLAQMMIVIAPRGAVNIHRDLTKAVMSARLAFLEKTDISTIINRFSQDMTLADLALPAMAFALFLGVAMCLVEVAFISVGSSYMAATIPAMILAVYCIQNFYLRTSRQMRILDLEAKTPLYQSLSETQEGLATIRSFGWQTYCQKDFLSKLDESQKPYYLMFCIQRWLTLTLQLTTAGVGVVLVALALLVPNSSDGSSLGLALTSILAFGASLQHVIEGWTGAETTLAGVTRTRDFVRDTPREESPKEPIEPPSSWPQGAVQVRNLELAYENGSKPLKDVSFDIPAGSKFAIAGRTGCGKSSIVACITRLIDPTSGSIRIDGLDVTSLPHERLRSDLICLPQDPLLFPGMSLRLNLLSTTTVPERRPAEVEQETGLILKALRAVGLADKVKAREGLDVPFNPGAWSQGEQQLFAVVRAIIRRRQKAMSSAMNRSRCLLLLDEATSAMDEQTETIFWKAVEMEFAGDTIIVIAHKERTLQYCDVVLTLEDGKVKTIDRKSDKDSTYKIDWSPAVSEAEDTIFELP